MDLILDIGNTRIKWAGAEAGQVVDSHAAAHAGSAERAFAALAASITMRPRRIVAASVAGPGFGATFARLAEAQWRLGIEWLAPVPEQLGLRCAYEEPARLGADRWAALLGARCIVREAVCVIDAGTTVTFDAVDTGGQHLGGLIFPGPQMVVEALDRGTWGIGRALLSVDPPSGLALLGRSTDDAVSHAAMLQVAAALDRVVNVLTRELEVAPRVLMTGGNGPAIVPWLETAVQYRADLVLEGLALVISQS